MPWRRTSPRLPSERPLRTLMTPAEQPAAATLNAPSHWRSIECVSDLHLKSADSPTFVAFERYLQRSSADALLILGDLFEAWVGDDAIADPFEQRCLALLQRAAQTRFVGFMRGNRDFLVGQDFLDACCATALHDPCVLTAFGQRFVLTHGDAWCLADTAYQNYRAQVRSSAWQTAVLSQPLAVRRELAARIRATSEAQRAHPHEAAHTHHSHAPETWADIDRPTAIAQLQSAHAHTLIHGHTHQPTHEALATRLDRWVLSDWDLNAHPPRADVLRLSASGVQRQHPF